MYMFLVNCKVLMILIIIVIHADNRGYTDLSLLNQDMSNIVLRGECPIGRYGEVT